MQNFEFGELDGPIFRFNFTLVVADQTFISRHSALQEVNAVCSVSLQVLPGRCSRVLQFGSRV
jgi:hypothetical protein